MGFVTEIPSLCVMQMKQQGARDSNHILDEVPEDNLNAREEELTTEQLIEERQQVRPTTSCCTCTAGQCASHPHAVMLSGPLIWARTG